jgi:adenylate cyclase
MRKGVQLSSNNPNFVADLAALYAVSGDRGRAREILTQLREASRKRYVAPYELAVIYCALGDKPKALEALDLAYRERSPWLKYLYSDSWQDGRLADLRREPGFIRLLRAVGPPGIVQ